MGHTFHSAEEIRAAQGQHLGYTDWLTIEQARIDQFAEATGDDQWIHVDPERAAEGPFGATIAHGYLTMSLSNYFLPSLFAVEGAKMGVNYGVDKVRFPAPVRVNSRVRCGAQVGEVSDVKGGVQVVIALTIEVEGQERPGCYIESISRFFF